MESDEFLLALSSNMARSKDISNVLRADIMVEEVVVEVGHDSALKLDLVNVWLEEQVRKFRGPKKYELNNHFTLRAR